MQVSLLAEIISLICMYYLGQSCFLYFSHTNSLFIVRDGQCGDLATSQIPPAPQCLLGRVANIFQIDGFFIWAQKFAIGKDLFTGRVEENISKHNIIYEHNRNCIYSDVNVFCF